MLRLSSLAGVEMVKASGKFKSLVYGGITSWLSWAVL